MATDAEQPSGDVAQKVAGFARSPGIASPTAGDVPGQLDHSKECLAFLRPLWAVSGQADSEKGLSSSWAVFLSSVIP